MKTFCVSILLIIWMAFTFILGISIIGAITFLVTDDHNNFAWFQLGKSLLEIIKK